MDNLFEIHLMRLNDLSFVKKYESSIVPIIEDSLELEDQKHFVVKKRLLPTTPQKAIVLFGEVIQ